MAGKLAVLGAVPLVAAAIAGVLLQRWLGEPALAVALAGLVSVPLWVWSVHRAVAPATSLFRALAGTATSYRDGDFSFSLRWSGRDELGELVQAHNQLGATLREQRLTLMQRELLLDTMVQHTPVAMLLCDGRGRVLYGNLAARHLLHGGARMEGTSLSALMDAAPAPMREAVARGGDGLFTVGGAGDEDEEEIYHLARRRFRLNARSHELLLIRQLTAGSDGGPPAPRAELGARRGARPRRRHAGGRPAERARAVLLDQAQRHRLGLPLAREIAEAHGGRIALANRPGGGLTVAITLPSP